MARADKTETYTLVLDRTEAAAIREVLYLIRWTGEGGVAAENISQALGCVDPYDGLGGVFDAKIEQGEIILSYVKKRIPSFSSCSSLSLSSSSFTR